MRLLALLVAPVVAWDLTYFSDELCATPATEVKGKDQTTSLTDVKGTSSVQTWALGKPGECVTFGEEIEVKADPAGSGPGELKAIKYAFGKVISCNEYGSSTISMYTKDYKDCVYVKDKADGRIISYSWSGTSMCQPLWAQSAVPTFYPGVIARMDAEKPGGSYRVNCNPNPADVCAICLGSLAIVFSFVAIGLAVVAKGK